MRAILDLQPDHVRPAQVAAISMAITLHLAVMGLLLRPMPLSLPAIPLPDLQVVDIHTIHVVPPKPPQAPLPPRPVIQPRHVPAPIAPPITKANDNTAQQSTQAAQTEHSETPQAIHAIHAPPSILVPPGKEGLEVVAGSHPPYPLEALRAGVEGEVVLMVSVDASGRPVSVDILKSSGNRFLDRAARLHVLRQWRFKATGVPQSARLPIKFTLQ